MSKVTEKNTKKEIMEYVKELEMKLSEKANSRKTTEDVKRETRVKEIKESAAKLIATGIVNEKTEAQYNNLLETIKLLEIELKEVYEIQRTANTLEALLITYQDKKESLEKTYQEKLLKATEEYHKKCDEFDIKLKQIQINHDKLIAELREQFREEKQKLEKDRAREKEEYAYNLSRERNIENDKWEDEKAQREAILSNRESEITQREAKVDELNDRITTYELRIDKLEKEKVSEYERGYEEGKVKAKKEAETSKIFSDKAHKTELERKDDLIESLKQSKIELKNEKDELQAKLDEAYIRIQNIAIETAKNPSVRMVETNNK